MYNYEERPPKLLRPNEPERLPLNDPERPARTPLTRPVLEFVRTATRPKPVGRCLPMPDAPALPTRDAENTVGLRTAL